MFRKTIQAAVCSLVIAGLSACGGGGGGGDDDGGSAAPSQATGDLTNSNYEQTARSSEAAVSKSTRSGQTAQALLPFSASPGSALDTTVRGLPRLALQHLTAKRTAQPAETQNCPAGGSLSFTATGSEDEDPRKGDKVTIVASACKSSQDAPALEGRVVITVLAYSDTQVSLSMEFDAFGLTGESVSGKVTFAASSVNSTENVKFTFEGLGVTGSGASAKSWYTMEIAENPSTGNDTLSINGYVTVGSEHYKLEQAGVFTVYGFGGQPASGKLRVIDKQGDYVELVAGSNAYTATFYSAGSTTAAAGPVSIAYH